MPDFIGGTQGRRQERAQRPLCCPNHLGPSGRKLAFPELPRDSDINGRAGSACRVEAAKGVILVPRRSNAHPVMTSRVPMPLLHSGQRESAARLRRWASTARESRFNLRKKNLLIRSEESAGSDRAGCSCRSLRALGSARHLALPQMPRTRKHSISPPMPIVACLGDVVGISRIRRHVLGCSLQVLLSRMREGGGQQASSARLSIVQSCACHSLQRPRRRCRGVQRPRHREMVRDTWDLDRAARVRTESAREGARGAASHSQDAK